MSPQFAAIVLCACGVEQGTTGIDDPAKLALAASIADACPVAAPNDTDARTRCSDALTELAALRDTIADPVLWDGQPAGMPVDRVIDEARLIKLNPRVWRRSYLSTFMFEGGATLEQAGQYLVLRMPVQFRNALDAGQYPYPFWHSDKKWRSYEQATELLIYFLGDQIVGAVRSEKIDESRPHLDRVWDGEWTWDAGAEPQNALYPALFSNTNPHRGRLETAYRRLEDSLKSQNCTSCHDPSNPTNMRHLEMLNYPNQALSGRHDVVQQLEQNAMPPGAGVADQITRLDLIRLAREFAEAGDEALAFEGER